MSDVVIKAENISKLYQLGQIGTGTLRHDMVRWWAKIWGKEDPFTKIGQVNIRNQKAGKNEFVYALQHINFEIRQGETLGIIGKNGAGKSTLLKILSRVTSPTTGQIKVKGRIASLLEVGTGFHPELTGRENIFLNGAILGMNKQKIRKKLDEIVDFSGIEKYIDTPVKRYSSGMYVRLAFAVAANLEAEILIVDEVLAVGDDEFQKKCLGKMQDVSGKEGRTVLFVSHNMGAVQRLCQLGILLKDGLLVKAGKISQVVNYYVNEYWTDSLGRFNIPAGDFIDTTKGYATELIIEDDDGNVTSKISIGKKWKIRVKFIIIEKLKYFIVALNFKSLYDISVRTVFTKKMEIEPGLYEIVFTEDMLLFGESTYKISVGLSVYEKPIHYVENVAQITFTSFNIKEIDENIIRLDKGVILNSMKYKLIKY